jgi:hypothetical protein
LDGLLEVVKVDAAGVGFVAEHHSGPLAVAHGAGAAVGEQVDIDVFGFEQKGVVAGFPDGFFPFLPGRHFNGFHHFDLPGLGPGAAAGLFAHCLESVWHMVLFSI